MYKGIKIKRKAFINMVASFIEKYKEEANGIIFGKKENGEIIVENVYGFINDVSKFERNIPTVGHKNNININRLFDFLDIEDMMFIGEYHTHPWEDGSEFQKCSELSEMDIEAINYEKDFVKKKGRFPYLNEWIEIVIGGFLNYNGRKNKDKGIDIWREGKDTITCIKLDYGRTYKLRFSAYRLEINDKKISLEQLPIYVEN